MCPAMHPCFLVLAFACSVAAVTTVKLDISAQTPGTISSDKVAVYYPSTTNGSPFFVGNDGDAAGGITIWDILSLNVSSEPISHKTGRSKLVGVVYAIAEKDWVVTLSQADGYLRLFDAETKMELESARVKVWGDFSAMCSWQGGSEQYLYIFGKNQVKMYMIRTSEDGVDVLEIRTSVTPIEAETCIVISGSVLFAGGNGNVYSFPTTESTSSPSISILISGRQEITSMTTYKTSTVEYLFIVYESSISVFTSTFSFAGRIELGDLEDYELKDVAILQSSYDIFPSGALVLAIESEDFEGFATSSLESFFLGIKITANTDYDPRSGIPSTENIPQVVCSDSGYILSNSTDVCECFAGFTGDACDVVTCEDDCSGHGSCGGPNKCECNDGWSGPVCGFQVAYPKYETEENGADGDDPAIWISPFSTEESRIITSTKSEDGTGLAVFDLKGTKLQTFFADEPNNVDVIYSFPLKSNQTVDLAYAACRGDNTLCIFEITSNGTIVDIPGSIQETPEDYEVYGSCTYHSPITDKFYLFVNAKDATYLQYELSSFTNGTLSTTLIRSFRGGSGGQVEGCVVDDENGWLILGEEPYGLWRYDAEPPENLDLGGEDKISVGYLIDSIEGNLFSDVEGVTIIPGSDASKGLIIVSCQGLSTYNVYKRAYPHDFVKHFQILASLDGEVDRTTNTDGVAAVGIALNVDFPYGLLVVHDDVNEDRDGGVSIEAAFKLISLADILDDDLLTEVDTAYDPRA